ncbi:DinB family protein [Blastococcus sp. TF02-8]|uniref:mycothiol transferase n=1 Tax=Blastococcus sp. TF02-8 TaxID=2250574 RepID=UPI003513181D
MAPDANPIGWLAWHLLRVQDDHVAEVAGREQVWTAAGWAERFGLPFGPEETGYGFDAEQVAATRIPSPELLTGYAGAVHAQSAEFLRGITDADLDRVVDDRWDPPVTLWVRLVSVIGDDFQHLGQIGYLRGLLP